MKASIVKADSKDAQRWEIKRIGKGVSQAYKDFISIAEGLEVGQTAILKDIKSAGQIRYFKKQAQDKKDIPDGSAYNVLERDGEVGLKRVK